MGTSEGVSNGRNNSLSAKYVWSGSETTEDSFERSHVMIMSLIQKPNEMNESLFIDFNGLMRVRENKIKMVL